MSSVPEFDLFPARNVLVVRLRDPRRCGQARNPYQALVSLVQEQRPLRMLIDLAEVRSLTSSQGLNCLHCVRAEISSYGGELAICGLSSDIREIFTICRLDRLFLIFDSQDAALRYLSCALEDSASARSLEAGSNNMKPVAHARLDKGVLAQLLAGLSVAIYLVSFFLPVAEKQVGAAAFFIGFFALCDGDHVVWLANPAAWAGLVYLMLRRWRPALAWAAAAVLLALSLLLWGGFDLEDLGTGYFVWWSSFVVLFLAACVACVRQGCLRLVKEARSRRCER